MIKKNYLLVLLLSCSGLLFAQSPNKLLHQKEAERILKVLSSDDMQGRKIHTPSIDRAGDFIASEFKKYNLQPFPDLEDYRQSFTVAKAIPVSAEGQINDSAVEQKNIIAFTSKAELIIDEKSGFHTIRSDSSENLMKEARELLKATRNYLVLVDSSRAAEFSKLGRLKRWDFKKNNSVVFVLTNRHPVTWRFRFRHEITESVLSNITGMIRGRSKPDEFVIFSAHYDHLGTGKPNEAMDSVYNGANDDAAGTTAVMMLANYFSKLKNNERSILFVAFTAEESGGFGSSYFSTQINPDKVMAMFNIEMIGTESKWGANSAYITGYDKSDFGKILQQNLAGTDFHFEPDPYPAQKLFYRSDNATLASLGVPAHTISTSKMDEEKYYHTVEDEIETLNLKNMAAVIKAIALSSKTIISGTDTPSRIEP